MSWLNSIRIASVSRRTIAAAGGLWDAAPVPRNYFGERIAKSYQAKWPELFEPGVVDPAVRFLARLAGTGAALELGVGTGRLAIPLSRRGVRVHGIDLSPDMVAELRASPGTGDIGVTVGDFATTRVGGTFRLAYLVRNTIMNLTTQDAQVACFQNVAAQLEAGGCFVIEVGVPGLQRLPAGETVRAFAVTRSISASRGTTRPHRSPSPTTTGWSTASWRPSRPRSARCGRRSWT